MDARVRSVGYDPFVDQPLRCAIDMSTASVPAGEQFDFYRSWFAGVAEIQLLRDERQPFAARHRVWQLADMALGTVQVPGCPIRWEHLKRPLLDHWALSVPLSRSPAGKEVPGKSRIQLKCLELPHAAESSDDMFITLYLPRTWPATRSSHIEASNAALSFLARYAIVLHRSVPQLRQTDAQHIATATANLFAAVLRPSNDNFAAAQGPINAVATTRIAKIVAERLADHDLTPDTLCRAVGVSRSHLYRIFEPAGGVSNYIRRKRLLKTRDALADSSDRRTISSIAEGWSFADASTFSRMFKLEFGMSPKEARELGWQGVRHSSWLSIDQPHGEDCMLSNLLINSSLGLSHFPRQ